MHLYLDKKTKIFFYLFLFFLLTTISNSKILEISKIYLVKNIEVNNIDSNFKKIIEKNTRYIIGQNIFFINKKEIKDNFNRISFIETFDIKKKLPSTLIINIKKTSLLAKININNKKYYLGSNGHIIENDLIKLEKDIPNFFGDYQKEKFSKLLFYIKKNGFKLNNIKSFYYFPSGRWDLETKNGIKIKLPTKKLGHNLLLSKKIIKKNKDKNNYVIDLRIKDQVIIYDKK